MHKSDIKTLKILLDKNCTSELKSYTIPQLLPLLKCSYSKAHNILTSLCIAEYVQEGIKNSRANTYYITRKGIEKLRRLSS